jgi:hypothetical protein
MYLSFVRSYYSAPNTVWFLAVFLSDYTQQHSFFLFFGGFGAARTDPEKCCSPHNFIHFGGPKYHVMTNGILCSNDADVIPAKCVDCGYFCHLCIIVCLDFGNNSLDHMVGCSSSGIYVVMLVYMLHSACTV